MSCGVFRHPILGGCCETNQCRCIDSSEEICYTIPQHFQFWVDHNLCTGGTEVYLVTFTKKQNEGSFFFSTESKKKMLKKHFLKIVFSSD